ncbi:MAG: hypothetical protein U5L04_02665 [Trueperaceae bacterium]|nr:hypothetical protein [Trueperaceae bacterium]
MTLAIINMTHDGNAWRWETGDGTLIEGVVSREGGDSASSLEWTLSDPLLEWAERLPLPTRNSRVAVEAWLGDTQSPPKVFAGYLNNHTVGGPPGRLQLTAVDKSKSLRRVARSRTLSKSSIPDLLRRLCEPHGISVDLSRADLDDLEYAQVLQHGETDSELIDRILGSVGHRGFYQNDTLYVIESGRTRDRQIRLVYGQNVSQFNFEVDELTTSTTPNVTDFEGHTATKIDDQVEAVDRPVELSRETGLRINFDGLPSFTDQQLEQAKKAQARAKKVFKGQIQATEGFPEATVDDEVILEGFGQRYSGVWFVDSLSHSLKTGRTSFNLENAGSQ